MELSKSTEDYIEAIYMIEKENGIIKSINIANRLGVSKPAVNRAMNELINMDLISKPNYSDIVFTEKGRKVAEEVYNKHILIHDFLISLGVSEEIAEIDCCKIEHVISDETLKCIKKRLESTL